MTAPGTRSGVHVTSGSRLQARLEETAADVVLSMRSRILKKGRDVTLSPALQSERSENSSSGGAATACRAGITVSDVRNLDVSVDWPARHRGMLQLANAVLSGGLVVVSVCLATAIGYSQQIIVFVSTLGQVLRAIEMPFIIVSGDFNMAGEVLEQLNWLHAGRARVAASRQRDSDVLGLDGLRQGHRFLRGVRGAAPSCQGSGGGRQP